jgi:hypothetical protein
MKRFTLYLILAVLSAVQFYSCRRLSDTKMQTVYPKEYTGALRNPHKGFTNRGFKENNEWATLTHSYIRWNEIERDSSDGIERIKAWCDENWKEVENNNMKVIPRVYLHWDGDRTYWPSDLETFDYTSPQFQRRLENMIRKLGACWDTDPRVAHVEMGIIGKWGEHHSPEPSKEVEHILGQGFRKAFQNKKVMVRHPWEFREQGFGIYWDSWAHYDQMDSHGQGIYEIGDRWKTEIIGGEAAYDWGNWKIQPGENPTATVRDSVHRNFFIHTIRWLHCTQLRWVGNYNQEDPAARAGAEEIQKVFGYRFVIDKVTFPEYLNKGKDFNVAFTVRNTGSAPFYYQWPVELSLLDDSNQVVWASEFENADIRTWMPGEGNYTSAGYEIKAEPFHIEGIFKLPENIPSGKYKLALAVLDPAGRLPSLRFAIENYINGGRHPVGFTGVEYKIKKGEEGSLKFDDPGLDKSLRYVL